MYSLCLKLVGCEDISHCYDFVSVNRQYILRHILEKKRFMRAHITHLVNMFEE